jgi:hypothetical protein
MDFAKAPIAMAAAIILWLALYRAQSPKCDSPMRMAVLAGLPFSGSSSVSASECIPTPTPTPTSTPSPQRPQVPAAYYEGRVEGAK